MFGTFNNNEIKKTIILIFYQARVLVEKNEELDTAEKYHQDALYMLEKSLGHRNQRVAYTLNLLGELYAKQGKFENDGYDKMLSLEQRNDSKYKIN